jgi:hypothetical protein
MLERSLAEFDMCDGAYRLATRAAGQDAGVAGMASISWPSPYPEATPT